MYNVTLDGKKYPFYFGAAALDGWQCDTGREDMNLTDLDSMMLKTRHQVDFMFYGLKYGAKMEGGEVGFDRGDLLIMIDKTPGSYVALMEMIAKCMTRSFLGTDADETEAIVDEYLTNSQDEAGEKEEGK